MTSIQASISADTTKAMWMTVNQSSLSLAYWLALRKICSRWIEEIATIVDATLIFSEPASILPS